MMNEMLKAAYEVAENYIWDNRFELAEEVAYETLIDEDEGGKYIIIPHLTLYVWQDGATGKYAVSRFEDDYEDIGEWRFVTTYEDVQESPLIAHELHILGL